MNDQSTARIIAIYPDTHAPARRANPAIRYPLPPPSIRAIANQGIHALGDAYINGEWSSANLDHTMAALFTEEPAVKHPLPLLKNIVRKRRLAGYIAASSIWNLQRGARSLQVAKRHYDLGNDLFEAMLDRSMTYTCGVWNNAQTLEEAQLAKLRLLCTKLNLEPGMHILDIGCGWGNFAEYAAREYGVSVTGVTISKEQAAYAQQRCKGLPVTITLQDYRFLAGTFDRIVSIEMIEAVGKKNLGIFFDTVDRCLKPGGLFALQAISAETVTRFSRERLDEFLLWILRHIFPNGYLPTLPELTTPARSRFVLEHLENLGDNYDRTLMAWAHNFELHWPKLSDRYDERFHRMWRFYLLSCAALFRTRITQVYQILYRKVESHRSIEV